MAKYGAFKYANALYGVYVFTLGIKIKIKKQLTLNKIIAQFSPSSNKSRIIENEQKERELISKRKSEIFNEILNRKEVQLSSFSNKSRVLENEQMEKEFISKKESVVFDEINKRI